MNPRIAPLLCLPGCLWAAPLPAQESRVPFQAGLEVTWALVQAGEPDYEAVLTVESADSSEAIVRWAWNRGTDRLWKEWKRPLSTTERQRARSAYFYATEGGKNQYRGSTPAMISGAILDELKHNGRADIVILYPQVSTRPFRGTLERVGAEDELFEVLLDGEPTMLPGIRTRGVLHGEFEVRNEVVFLDNPEAPWELESSGEGDPDRVHPVYTRLVRIETGARRSGLGDMLAERCRTSVHDIYFATGSDALDATSAPALQAIADVLRSHPDWSVTLIGHTDSEGSEESNLELSRRRAERVRLTLVEEYGIAAGRLAAEGRGEKEPVADNGTPEGRAQNRRVDIERPCETGRETGG